MVIQFMEMGNMTTYHHRRVLWISMHIFLEACCRVGNLRKNKKFFNRQETNEARGKILSNLHFR